MELVLSETTERTTLMNLNNGKLFYRTKLYDLFRTLPDEIVEMIVLPVMREYYSKHVMTFPNMAITGIAIRHHSAMVTYDRDHLWKQCACRTKKGTPCKKSRKVGYNMTEVERQLVRDGGDIVKRLMGQPQIKGITSSHPYDRDDTHEINLCATHLKAFAKLVHPHERELHVKGILSDSGYRTRNGYLVKTDPRVR